MTDPTAPEPDPTTIASGTPKPSGWDTTRKVAGGVGTVAVSVYGIVLIVIGIAIMTAGGGTIAVGVAVAAYGLYLAIPGGRKWVIY